MRRRRGIVAVLAATAALIAGAVAAPAAPAAFGLNDFDVTFTNKDGTAATQAGSHPYAMTTSFGVNYTEPGAMEWIPDGELKNAFFEQVEGLVGDATAIPRCSTEEFLTGGISGPAGVELPNTCPAEAAVGIVRNYLQAPFAWSQNPVYNLEPPPGVAVRIGFKVIFVPVIVDIGVKQSRPHNVVASLTNIPQLLTVFGSKLQLWGNPADPGHDAIRGPCGDGLEGEGFGDFMPGFGSGFGSFTCPVDTDEKPFLTLPRSCTGLATSTWQASSWEEPNNWVGGSALTHDNAEPPNPQGFTGCAKLDFEPSIEGRTSTNRVETGTGFDFNVEFDDEGLTSKDGLAQSDIKKAVVTLPEGVTVNPSVGEGLGVCTPADLDRETIAAPPGAGCPNASKIGTVNVETPLLHKPVGGSVFLAQQDDPATSSPGAENPFDSLIAFYIVLEDAERGILVKLPARVEPDPSTGQLVTTIDDVPQLPFSDFEFHFREGQRAPLVSPPACGTYTTKAELTPWADPSNPLTVTSSFEIVNGIDGGPCPPGGLPPFEPDFEAGSVNNNAKSFSPFNMRLVRGDGEQDMTRFSATLPPGVLGKLAGVDKCGEAAIAAARAKTGRQELAAPSCPANSQIGRTLAGAGVGGALTYVGGKLYLAGAYRGAPLSVVAVTPAVAGPFDAGTVVVREALTLNPVTAQVEVDGERSDPIPHILKGIPLKLRDLRVYVDRPEFILNPTSCDPSQVKATLFGSFLDVFDPADDVPTSLAARFQAANCLNLGFKPSLKLMLRGARSAATTLA